MKEMKYSELVLKQAFGRKVYYKGSYAWVAKYYSSKWWWPFDWYRVKIIPD